jgi:hypothetical protein
VADSEDAVETSERKLETVISEHGINISTHQTKKKKNYFKGRDTVRSKLVINNNIVNQSHYRP